MKKDKWFKLIDIIIYFNVFMFISVGVFSLKENIQISIFSFLISFVNLMYLVYVIGNRLKIYKLEEENLKIEYESEKLLKQEDNIDINKIKQTTLERRIETEIKHYFKNSKIIRNAYIPKNDGSFSEIDLIAITTNGIFIIESKNITGTIDGTWNQDNLTIIHPGGEKFNLYNPIKQNTNHFNALKNILEYGASCFRNLVVFGDKTYIRNFKNIPSFARVCKVNNLIPTMSRFFNKYSTKFEDHQIESIYDRLLPFVTKTEEKEAKHIDNVLKIKEESNESI